MRDSARHIRIASIRSRILVATLTVSLGMTPRVSAQPASAKPVSVQPASRTAVVNHSAFDTLLRRYVVDGFVDYAAFRGDPSFARYLASLDGVRVATLDDDERLAFWINVYNAFTIQLVASHAETESIRNIEKTFGVLQLKGPWSGPIVHAAGRTLTLDDVEHAIIRKEFSEPRIHFALVYAAVGCPPLRSEAYTGAKLEEQLDDQGRRFLLASPGKNRLEQRGFSVALSPIFTYYRDDFGATRPELGGFLAHWADGELKTRLEKGAFVARETRFDWTLNSQAKGKLLAAQARDSTAAAAKDSVRNAARAAIPRP